MHIRAYLAAVVWARIVEGLGRAGACCGTVRFKWLARMGHVPQNPAALVATPKLPKHLPRVPTIEQMNRALDSKDVADEEASVVAGS